MNFPGYRQLSIKVFLIYRLQFITVYRSRSIISDARDVKNGPPVKFIDERNFELVKLSPISAIFENYFDLNIIAWKFHNRRLSITDIYISVMESNRIIEKNLPTFRFHVYETNIRILRAGRLSPRSKFLKKKKKIEIRPIVGTMKIFFLENGANSVRTSLSKLVKCLSSFPSSLFSLSLSLSFSFMPILHAIPVR